jgi:hypothetical protein
MRHSGEVAPSESQVSTRAYPERIRNDKSLVGTDLALGIDFWRITLVFYRKRAFENECACTMLWRAFDKTVRRKPLAGAADAECYGNSIDFCLKSLARRGV